MIWTLCQQQWGPSHDHDWSCFLSHVITTVNSSCSLFPSQATLVFPGLQLQPRVLSGRPLILPATYHAQRSTATVLDFDPCVLPLQAKSIDLALLPLSLDFLPSLEAQQACITELCRVLSSTGVAVLIQWRRFHWVRLIEQWRYAYALPPKRLPLPPLALKSLLDPLGYEYNSCKFINEIMMTTPKQKAMARTMRVGLIQRESAPEWVGPWHPAVSYEGGL